MGTNACDTHKPATIPNTHQFVRNIGQWVPRFTRRDLGQLQLQADHSVPSDIAHYGSLLPCPLHVFILWNLSTRFASLLSCKKIQWPPY
jgi:hypothetical protein